MKTLLIAAFTVILTFSATAGEWTWTNLLSGGAYSYWHQDGLWVPAGYPHQIDDVAVLVDLDDNTVEREIRIDNEYFTCSVVRCTADTNRYQIDLHVYRPDALYMESSSGNAQIIVDDQYSGDGTPALLFTGHNLTFLSDTDIIVSDQNARIQIDSTLGGSGAVNKYGPGQFSKSGIDEGYTGTLTIHDGYVRCNNPNAFSNANAVVVKNGCWLYFNYGNGVGWVTDTPLVFEDGWLANEGNTTGPYKTFRDITVNSALNVSSKWYDTVFDGSIAGTGTVYVHKRPFYVFADVMPGFSIGDLTFRRVDGTFYFGTNGNPATIHIEVGGGTSDRILFENMNADIDLANVDVVFDGSGNQGATNWFLLSNRITTDSEFNNVSAEPGTIVVDVIYDYDNDMVGAVIMPEPAIFGLLLVGAALLKRR